ncbi:MAG: class F sortase, partial [Pseudonocardia sp.]|nr:class F sortase [Pseudonocardia sp.]
SVLVEARPQRLVIPSLDVDAPMMNLGLRDDGSMEVPPDGATVGWYDRSPTPGELGPAVLAAHVDWRGERGVFHRLGELERGDEVRVRRADGATAVFAVRRVEQYPKDEFPSQEVYGDVDGPELRLLTCGGEFDSGARSYRDNIVVYAGMTGTV